MMNILLMLSRSTIYSSIGEGYKTQFTTKKGAKMANASTAIHPAILKKLAA